MKKLTVLLFAVALLVGSTPASADDAARRLLEKRKQEIEAKEAAIAEKQREMALKLERDSADYKAFYNLYIDEGLSEEAAKDKASADMRELKVKAFFSSVGDSFTWLGKTITLQTVSDDAAHNIKVAEWLVVGGLIISAVWDTGKYTTSKVVGNSLNIFVKGGRWTNFKLFGATGIVWLYIAQIIFSSSVDYSNFNQPVYTIEERVDMLEESPGLFVNPGGVETDVHTHNLQQIFAKYPYMEKYMDDYLTVVSLSVKYSVLPFADIEKEFRALPAQQQKNSSYYAIAAKHLVPFDNAASSAMSAKFKEDSKNIKPFEAEIPVTAQDNLKVKGQNIYKAEKILFQK